MAKKGKAPNKTFIVLFLIILGIVLYFFYTKTQAKPLITSFQECQDAGNPVMESYPMQCKTPDGRTFTQEIPSVPGVTPGEGEQTFCTMDAKICPDGSAVGRSGPNCEFSPCPGE